MVVNPDLDGTKGEAGVNHTEAIGGAWLHTEQGRGGHGADVKKIFAKTTKVIVISISII